MSKTFTEIEQQILREISICMYEYENQDYVRADSHVKQFGITDIVYNETENIAYITLIRPGIIIGSKGVLIEAITKHLKKKINKDLKISLIENRINECFLSFSTVMNYLDNEY